ncbi:hypothetical protein DRJ17_03690 [Candidatus Woesearchaeota archaeon]|nr:MAG: hypothetical protein DRJ17_03690 [Candidatus Woesearchaeota archaeon]
MLQSVKKIVSAALLGTFLTAMSVTYAAEKSKLFTLRTSVVNRYGENLDAKIALTAYYPHNPSYKAITVYTGNMQNLRLIADRYYSYEHSAPGYETDEDGLFVDHNVFNRDLCNEKSCELDTFDQFQRKIHTSCKPVKTLENNLYCAASIKGQMFSVYGLDELRSVYTINILKKK